jgi:hypothetical protein
VVLANLRTDGAADGNFGTRRKWEKGAGKAKKERVTFLFGIVGEYG